MTTTTLHEQLRVWARGSSTLVAATELLIRVHGGRFAGEGRPWVHTEANGSAWIDFDAIEGNIGALSGGERRVLRIAASIGGDVRINIGDELAGVDYEQARLVLAAVAHATGYSEDVRTFDIVDGEPQSVTKPALGGWPTDS